MLPTIEDFAWGARKLSEKDAPQLFKAIRELLDKTGSGKPMPSVILSPHSMPNPMAFKTISGDSGILVTQGTFDTLGCTLDSINDEMRAILGHELHHYNDLKWQTSVPKNLPWMAALVTVAATLIYDRVQKNKKRTKERAALYEMLNEAQQEVRDEFKPAEGSALPVEAQKSIWDRVTEAGKYVVAAAVGLAIGTYVGLRFQRHHEFRADALGAELTSNGAMSSALTKLYGALDEYFSKHPLTSTEKLMLKFFDPHPTLKDRTSALFR
jgi:Zn-dependent protease with chaperone function